MTIVPGEHGCNKKFPIQWLNKDYEITDGRKEMTDQGELMFVKYVRKVVYYTIEILIPPLRKQSCDHFKKTHRLIKDDPYNGKITIIEPREHELAILKQFGTVTTRNGLAIE
jgi:hypothetical protein